jgi:hypothetical protein
MLYDLAASRAVGSAPREEEAHIATQLSTPLYQLLLCGGLACVRVCVCVCVCTCVRAARAYRGLPKPTQGWPMLQRVNVARYARGHACVRASARARAHTHTHTHTHAPHSWFAAQRAVAQLLLPPPMPPSSGVCLSMSHRKNSVLPAIDADSFRRGSVRCGGGGERGRGTSALAEEVKGLYNEVLAVKRHLLDVA